MATSPDAHCTPWTQYVLIASRISAHSSAHSPLLLRIFFAKIIPVRAPCKHTEETTEETTVLDHCAGYLDTCLEIFEDPSRLVLVM